MHGWCNITTQISLAFVERIILVFIYLSVKHLRRPFFARIVLDETVLTKNFIIMIFQICEHTSADQYFTMHRHEAA